MFSPRGVMMLAHNVHDIQSAQRHVHANRLNGVDNEWLTPEQAKAFCPPLNIRPEHALSRSSARPCSAAAAPRGTTRSPGATRAAPTRWASTSSRTARSPASAARATGWCGVETTRGFIGAKKVAVVAAGHTSVVMAMAGLRMPLESVPLQALVSEPVKPCFPCVVMSNTIHAYISQSDKGELVIGAGTDQYVSYSQRGSFQIIEHTLEAICELFPMFRRMRMLRQWAGIVDVTPDRSPIIGKTPVRASTSTAAGAPAASRRRRARATSSRYTVAKDEPHPINAPFTLERFTHRPPDRRGGGGRGGALRMCGPLPTCRPPA